MISFSLSRTPIATTSFTDNYDAYVAGALKGHLVIKIRVPVCVVQFFRRWSQR